jgi:ChrR Cupin-like domain
MISWRTLSVVLSSLSLFAGCSGDPETSPASEPKTEIPSAKILDLEDVAAKPEPYEWFDFRPNIKKLILAGAAETQHIAILWYTVTDGGVALHYHAKTESVYVIDGTQTDAKGTYGTGTVYFNPPGSGHQVTDSSGFFLLAYAAPPDFAATDLIDDDYTPVRIDTTAADLTTTYAFEEQKSGGARLFEAPLDTSGGLAARFLEISATDTYDFEGNYLLVLSGSCDVEGVKVSAHHLVVGDSVEPKSYAVAASEGGSCLALGLSF